MNPALLIIDVQKAYFKTDSAESRSLSQAAETINAAIALFRRKELPVIVVQHADEKQGVVPGSSGFEFTDILDVLPTDSHVHKRYGNAFNKTNLKRELDALKVDTLLLTGFCAEYCVLSTYRGAMDEDLTPIILRDALISGVPENIGFVERISETISFGALEKMLE